MATQALHQNHPYLHLTFQVVRGPILLQHLLGVFLLQQEEAAILPQLEQLRPKASPLALIPWALRTWEAWDKGLWQACCHPFDCRQMQG